MYTVEHYTTSNGGGGQAARSHQHFEQAESSSVQHHQHYNPPPVLHHTTTYEVQETFEPGQHIRVHHHHVPPALSSHFESSSHHHELAKSSGALAVSATSYKQEKHEKTQKTVQTTSHTGQPMVITEEMYVNEVTHPLNTTVSEKNYEITVQHYPPHKNLSWSNAETYLHIFLTFYFGYFASVLFFDGIIRNIALLYILEHTYLSTTIYIIHILFSIVMLAFCIWFMTVCWRWWRNKSLEGSVDGTSISEAQAIKPANKNRRKTSFSGYVLIAAIIMIIGFIVYLVLGLLDLSFKSKQDFKHYGNYHPSAYMCDVVIFVFRLIFWLVGIAALLILGKDRLVKLCCPSKQIKIGKERPVAVYQVNA